MRREFRAQRGRNLSMDVSQAQRALRCHRLLGVEESLRRLCTILDAGERAD
ncbi:MAG: hypothetical protein ACE5JL_00665 [Dehalococcoidia bacterium]